MGSNISCVSPNANGVIVNGNNGFAALRNAVDGIRVGDNIPPRVMRWSRRTVKKRVQEAAIQGLGEACIQRYECDVFRTSQKKRDLRFQAITRLKKELEDSGFSVTVNISGNWCDEIVIKLGKSADNPISKKTTGKAA